MTIDVRRVRPAPVAAVAAAAAAAAAVSAAASVAEKKPCPDNDTLLDRATWATARPTLYTRNQSCHDALPKAD